MNQVNPAGQADGQQDRHHHLPQNNLPQPGQGLPGQAAKPTGSSAGKPPLPKTSSGKFVSWILNYKTRQKLMLFFLFLLFGIVVMNHVKNVNEQNKNDNLTSQYQERQSELKALEEQYNQLLANNEALTKEKENSISAKLNQQGYDQLLAELETIKMLAGFKAVSGSGISITLNDKPDYVNTDPPDAIIHDSDVRRVVNLLINNGAAALSVNGMRIVNSSFIHCYGSTILCNKDYMIPPFVVSAIGPPDQLSAAILQDSVLVQRQEFGVVVKVEKKETLELPAFAESDNFEQYISLLEVTTP